MTQESQPKIIFEDPLNLTYHPLCKDIPMLEADSPEWIALVEDIRARGIDVPIMVDDQNRVIDGRHRLKAARQLKLISVPILPGVLSEHSGAAEVILAAIFHRRNLTKGAQAYLAYPLFRSLLANATDARLRNLKLPAGDKDPNNKTADALAEKYGVGRHLVFDAARAHKLFNQAAEAREDFLKTCSPDLAAKAPADLRAEWEPKILAGEVGLGACVAGIAGKEATKGKKKVVENRAILFADSWKSLAIRAQHWPKFSEEERSDVIVRIRTAIAQVPAEVRQAISKAIKESEKESK